MLVVDQLSLVLPLEKKEPVVGTSGTVVNVNFVGPDVTATAQAGFSTITIAAGGKFINFTDGGCWYCHHSKDKDR